MQYTADVFHGIDYNTVIQNWMKKMGSDGKACYKNTEVSKWSRLPVTQETDGNQLDFRPLLNNHAVPQNVIRLKKLISAQQITSKLTQSIFRQIKTKDLICYTSNMNFHLDSHLMPVSPI